MSARSSKTVAEAAETIVANCLVSRVRLLHRTITGIYDEALGALGLTSGQLNILVVIANYGPVSPGAIARCLNMEKSTVSRNVARMDRNGWLEVVTAGTGRELKLTLDAKGRALVLEALPAWDEAQTEARAVLGRRGADSIRSLGNAIFFDQMSCIYNSKISGFERPRK